MKSKLKKWLEKTGYPLEIRGESILSIYGFEIINSHIYKDNENNKFRELDLFAIKSIGNEEMSLSINLLIECKKSDKPFILINTDNISTDSFSFKNYLYGLRSIMTISLENSPNFEIILPKNSTSGFKLIQGFTNSDETIHKATNTLLKSFDFWLDEENDFLELHIEENTHEIAFPLLLIDAPFFELKLNSKNELELMEIDSGILHHKSHLPFGTIYESIPIPIVKVEKLDILIDRIIAYGKDILQFLENNPNRQIKEYYKWDYVKKMNISKKTT